MKGFTKLMVSSSEEEELYPGLSGAGMTDKDVFLLSCQRPTQVSREDILAVQAGDPEPLREDVKRRRDEVISGAMEEIFREYLPLRDALRAMGRHPAKVMDIGCGQGINNIFLHRDFDPSFVLVDIEETQDLWHGFAETGAGCASLKGARAHLSANGIEKKRITTVNPRRSRRKLKGFNVDFVTSLYSCGYHYPIDEYAELFASVVESGGAACLDLRRKYFRQKHENVEALLKLGDVHVLFERGRSLRVLIAG